MNFEEITSNTQATELVDKGILAPLYLMPPRFGGAKDMRNAVYAPKEVVEIKDRYDDMVENLLRDGKVDGYSCNPKYKGESIIPTELTLVAKYDGKPVFTETIHIWE